MDHSTTLSLFTSLEEIKLEGQTNDIWSARDLQKVLGYTKWENFDKVIDKAKIACKWSLQAIGDHFLEIKKPIKWGKWNVQYVNDYLLTRYACYLIAQNWDPKKVEIAFAQTYFAVKTRSQEIIEKKISENERLNARKRLSKTEKEFVAIAYEYNLKESEIISIRDKWDETLYGWKDIDNIKKDLWVPKWRSISDFVPDVILKAKDLAMWVTNYNIKHKNINKADSISEEHVKNNQGVRSYLEFSWIKAEEVPAEEDLKLIKKRNSRNIDLLEN